jgi:hypothetical protein
LASIEARIPETSAGGRWFEDLVELIRTEIVDFPRLGNAARAPVPPVAVENDADVARYRPAADLPDQPPAIKIIEKAEHWRQENVAPDAVFRAPPPGSRGSRIRRQQ